MAKTLPSSTGYFNKEMLAILKKGENGGKKVVKKPTTKAKSKKK